MKRVFTLISMLLIVQAFMTGIASAEYNESDDINLNLNAPVTAPEVYTGKLTFQTQEQVHQYVYRAFATSIDHSYIWISINGQSVAAIDPPKAMVRG